MGANATRQRRAEEAVQDIILARDSSIGQADQARNSMAPHAERASSEGRQGMPDARQENREQVALDAQMARLAPSAHQVMPETEQEARRAQQAQRAQETRLARQEERHAQPTEPDARPVSPAVSRRRRSRRTTPEAQQVARVARQEAQPTNHRCAFCEITSTYPPIHQWNNWKDLDNTLRPELTTPPSYVVYSGDYVMAFLDRAPLTYGHTLVIPRVHRVRMGDLEAMYAAELGRHLPLIIRAVMCAVFERDYNPGSLNIEDADYNVVQNSGPLAHQVVPHIHYHIIPRPPNPDMRYENPWNPPPALLPQVTTDYHAAWTIFGRGYRSSLEEDPRTPQLLKRLRKEIMKEFGRMELQGSYQQPNS